MQYAIYSGDADTQLAPSNPYHLLVSQLYAWLSVDFLASFTEFWIRFLPTRLSFDTTVFQSSPVCTGTNCQFGYF